MRRSLVGCHACKGDRLGLRLMLEIVFLVVIEAIACWLSYL
jgi:hypothetical protein